ncbi:hypothetical protein HIM_08271 [Hirsutella minnesotensis 3608]|uniref:Polyketide synthase n=1 Tax=Hirsutella minnesotensis 3608 TaxID=1043627 RepID=A0A0F7ZMP2_9HYPO|nr:hypothetical protein HIM_08271 [Hirsutella minnesotensis 3608]
MSFHVFGDRLFDAYGFFADFCRERRPGVLATAFIDQAGTALRDEASRAAKSKKVTIPAFKTLRQLNQKHHTSATKHLGVETALICAAQLCHYIDRVEKNPDELSGSREKQFVGFGVGLFAATVAASSASPAVLIPLAVQAVRLAFRVGCHVASTADNICDSGGELGHAESWTYAFTSVNAEKAQMRLAQFHKSNAISIVSRAYVSCVAADYVEISGPPSTLRKLVEQRVFGSEPESCPVYGPFHAAHLHSAVDIDGVFGLSDPTLMELLRSCFLKSPVISSDGAWEARSEATNIFRAAIRSCLTVPSMLQAVLERCTQAVAKSDASKSLVISHGPMLGVAGEFVRSLSKATKLPVVLDTPPLNAPETVPRGIGSHGSVDNAKLAIVGISGRFPDADSHEELWELLCNGTDVHREIPGDRFPRETHVDPTGKATNTTYTPYGCWIRNPGFFDPRFFNMSPREALQTDPMQRMAITTAYEALEMSGYVPNRTPSTRLDRIGTFYGQTSDDWREINAAQEIDTYYITGGIRAFGPGRINYFFGFSGPSLNIDTACSSSGASLQVACSSLLAGECDTAVVGGLSVLSNPDLFSGLSRGRFLSKKGPCATFDDAADGYCRADGCASVVVKRLDDAIADKDNVLGVILGTATNHSADAISITHPHGPTQSALSSAILDDAGVDPLDVDYVEMHGTGTQAGDSTEMVSVTNVFAPADRKRPKDRPLYLGSVKSNIGHGEAASGVTALIKVLKMLQHNAIPPHIGIKKGSIINSTFPKNLSERNVNIAFKMTPFQRKDGKPRRVFVNNFSAAGGNTGLLLEDAPLCAVATPDPRGTHVIAVTGKSKAAMIRNAEKLTVWMARNPETPVSHVAYTTTARRVQYNWRLSVAASSLNEARSAIISKVQSNQFSAAAHQKPSVAFIFTGQGSHYPGMGQELMAHFSVFRQTMREFESVANIHGLPSFISLVDGTEPQPIDPSPVAVQLAICCFEMALVRLWASWGLRPDVVLGHSLGEYAALNAAGVLSASDTIYLVGERARLVVDRCTANTHVMLAVQGSVMPIQEALGETSVTVACINSPQETVLAGEAAAMTIAARRLSNAGFKCTQLRVPFAFHSDQIDPILDELEKTASSLTFSPPKIQIVSPLLGRTLNSGEIDATYIRNHARRTVNFLGGLLSSQNLAAVSENTLWVEIGPHSICTNMVKAAFGTSVVAMPTARRNESVHKILGSSLSVLHSSGIDLDWTELHRDFSQSTRMVDLPSYAFEEKNYWLPYEGDWTLSRTSRSKAVAAIKPPKPKLSTTSVHRITMEKVTGETATVDTETNLSRDDILPSVTGHLCNGAPLCPSSLYADMAMTVSNYAHQLLRPNEQVGLNVAELEVPKALVFDEEVRAHVLQCSVEANASMGYARVAFFTHDGLKRTNHAFCKVYYGDQRAWATEFQRMGYLIKERMEALVLGQVATVSSISRNLAYKLFTSLVDYDRRYQGMEKVFLNSAACEAVANLVFQTTAADGDFFFNPYWIDSCLHLSGFIVNGTDAVDSREQVFVSHGWESLRFIESLDQRTTYQSYTRMQPVQGSKMMEGNVYIFDGDRLVGVASGVKFQSIPRKVLNMVLPPRGTVAASLPIVTPVQVPVARLHEGFTTGLGQRLVKEKSNKIEHVAEGPGTEEAVSVVFDFLNMIASETGCDLEELNDDVAFADVGCDSLMALTITGRIREEMEIDIDSHTFLECPTIGHMKRFLTEFEAQHLRKASEASQASSDLEDDGLSPSVFSSITTPMGSDEGSINCLEGNAATLRDVLRSTVAAEMGIDIGESLAAPDLSALGMDSLMALTISGTLREKAGVDIPSDLFMTNASLHAIEGSLGINESPKRRPFSLPMIPSFTDDKTTMGSRQLTPFPEITEHLPHRRVKSVLLQGNSRTATKTLFMIPDGSGCATSYTEMGRVSEDWSVWGMFSPFLKSPEEYTCGIRGIAFKFIQEMKVRQPVGPYYLAGWSVGGAIAYEMASQLTQGNEQVARLILIDAPSPMINDPLPKDLLSWFAEIGVLGNTVGGTTKTIPDWLLPHFAASATALAEYHPNPIPKAKCPEVMAIWCEDGVCKTPADPRPSPYPTGHALFLLDNRADFGPRGWEQLLDTANFRTRHMPGNHFTMMRGDLAKKATSFIREALSISD